MQKQVGTKEKVRYIEGIFGGPKVRVETYKFDSLVNNLTTQPTENPKMREALDEIENQEGSQNRDVWTKISDVISSVPNKPTSIQ